MTLQVNDQLQMTHTTINVDNRKQASAYPHEPRLRDLPLTLPNMPRMLLVGFIRFYQVFISPALPANTCRFYPTCSHYGYQSVYKYGMIKGGFKAIWRILRCNPFNPGGFDPLL